MRATGPSQHKFAEIAKAEIERSSFNRSSGLKTTFDSGLLIPIYLDEGLPGDTYKMKMHNFCRLATPLHPVMDNIHIDSFWFAVPLRLLWSNFQKFMGEQEDPGDSTDFTIPQIDYGVGNPVAALSISDYMGIPTASLITNLSHTAMFHRAYNLIWNQFFRDENIQDSVTINKGDGPDVIADYTLLRRGKRKDYMTSCLPWPQKGTASPVVIGGTAPAIPTGDKSPAWKVDANPTEYKMQSIVSGNQIAVTPNWVDGIGDMEWSDSKLEVDASSFTGNTINQLRQAFQIQRLLERDARGGTRYTEIIRSHFGVTSPDARLQRPEYLGGGSQNISITPVPKTTEDGTDPQGNLAGYGTSSASGSGFNKSFTEHCVIIGLVSVRADLTYQQGLNRMMSRETKYDFFWPALSHIGEQSVLNQEIVAVGDLIPGSDDLVFGYQGRYDEYRYKPSQITGQFRSSHPTTLDSWHLSQEFVGVPTLSPAFIEENPPIGRISAVPSEPEILFDAFFELLCARPIPMFGTPGMIDHF